MPGQSIPQTTAELLQRITDPFGVYCVLEVALPSGSSLFHVFPVMPESLAVTQRYLQTVTPTQGGVFVDEYGRAPSPVVLQGTFGRSPRYGISLGQDAMLANAGANGLSRITADATPGTLSLTGPVGVGAPVSVSVAPTTGYKLMKLLGEIVELSHVVDPATGRLPVARFYNFAFGAFYEVTLNSFEAQMSVQRNGLWVYRLEMTMLRRLNNAVIDSAMSFSRRGDPLAAYNAWTARASITPPAVRVPFLQRLYSADDLLTQAKKRSALQTIFDSVQKAEKFVQRVNGYATGVTAGDLIGYAAGKLDGVLKLAPGTINDFVNTVRRLPETMNAVRNIVYQIGTRLPADILRDLRTLERGVDEIGRSVTPLLRMSPTPTPSVTNTFVNAASLNTSVIPRIDVVIADLAEAVITAAESLDAIQTLLAVYGYTTGAATAPSVVLDPPPSDARGGSSQTYVVKQGDTLSDIALAFYSDENAWPRIAQANETVFGSLAAMLGELAPTDLLDNYIGKKLTIPSNDQATISLVPYVFDDPRGVRAFGTDLPETLSVVTRSDGSKELKVLDPFETLLQGLQHRVAMPQGAIPDDPEFGSQVPGLIGQSFGALDDSMNAAKVEEALRRDARLASISRVDARQNNDQLVVGFEAVARNAGSLGPVNLTVSRQSP